MLVAVPSVRWQWTRHRLDFGVEKIPETYQMCRQQQSEKEKKMNETLLFIKYGVYKSKSWKWTDVFVLFQSDSLQRKLSKLASFFRAPLSIQSSILRKVGLKSRSQDGRRWCLLLVFVFIFVDKSVATLRYQAQFHLKFSFFAMVMLLRHSLINAFA